MALWDSPYAPGVTELLGVLDKKTLEALAVTATANRILPEGRIEATELILRYTDNLARLFSYKRMTSQVLLEYLHQKKVPVRAGLSKTELIDRVRDELEKSVKENKPILYESITNKLITKKSITPDTTNVVQDTTSRKLATTEPPQHWPASPSVNFSLTTTTTNAAMNLSVNAAAASVSLDVQQTNNSVGSGGGEMSEVFAREFCKWFYTMVNRLQPEAFHLQGDTLTADVFVANSSVDVYLYTGQQVIEKHAVGRQDAFTTLRDTLLECGVCFAPDLDRGMWCEMSNFGMVKLRCSGTLHRCETLVGVFEQEFGLVKCPEGKWKVMVVKVNLKKA